MGAKVQRGPKPDYKAIEAAGGVGKDTRRDRERPRSVAPAASAQPLRRTPLKPRSPDYERKHGEDFGAQAEACRMLKCAACGWTPRRGEETDPHHEPPRSLGGTDADCVPLGPSFLDKGYGCGCHQLRHSMTEAEFWEAAGKDPEQVKAQVRAFMETDAFLLRGEA